MANSSLVSLESLGWKPYWDELGHYPVQEDDLIGIQPSTTIEMYWICRPTQEEDGHWYGNEITVYDPFPSFIGGVYREDKIRSDSFLFGSETDPSIVGKVEEFSMWGKAIGVPDLQGYQNIFSKIIGEGESSKYQDIEEATDAGLKYHYNFGGAPALIKNFDNVGDTAVKSRNMPVVQGKYSNATNMIDVDDFITIENMNFSEEFSMNARFLMSEMKDFVIFKNKKSLIVSFDASNSVFKIEFVPYIGKIEVFNVEYSSSQVDLWYDLGVDFKDGILSVIINGDLIETFRARSSIGGAIKTSLDMTNFSSVSVRGHQGLGIIDAITSFSGEKIEYWTHLSPSDGDGKSNSMLSDMHEGRFDYTLHGGDNLVSLLYDRERGQFGGSPDYASSTKPTATIADEVSGEVNIKRLCWGQSERITNYMYMHIDEDAENDTARIHLSSAGYGSWYQTMGTSDHPKNYNISWFANKISPYEGIKLTMVTKDDTVSQVGVFPKVMIVPGCSVKVNKVRMVPETEILTVRDYIGAEGFVRKRDSNDTPDRSSFIWSTHYTPGREKEIYILKNNQHVVFSSYSMSFHMFNYYSYWPKRAVLQGGIQPTPPDGSNLDIITKRWRVKKVPQV